jgi:hypothetical protein
MHETVAWAAVVVATVASEAILLDHCKVHRRNANSNRAESGSCPYTNESLSINLVRHQQLFAMRLPVDFA